MPTYEKWNEDNTERLSLIVDPDQVKLDKMGDYLLVVVPDCDHATQELGVDTFTETERSWEVDDLSPLDITVRLEAKNAGLKAYAKDKAYRLIIAAIPEWKQRNLSARAIELQEIRFEGGSLTAAEDLDLQEIRLIFVNIVKPIRLASDRIEAEIDAGTTTTIDQIENHIEWPESGVI